jgi:hypothetical protein
METLSEAIRRLDSAGFREDFRATARGLQASTTGVTYQPESLEIEEVLRFEGPTDPGDESILFALRSRSDGVLGTFAAAYGPGMDAFDAEMVRRLGGAGSPTRREAAR